ncbi:hypothetical protein [Alloyangia pacifica]|uniref:Uncharacterized protein n=1 Tax=Alloyangia pacifica TaxID=311180 RepID=A0A1I6QRR4_9RHOB|nr:hypothetical protein [Alloyangia pacifica]SDF96407.1 hypothetical protein SAMN04488245_101263 [Alloyangia pacifica]SFS55032.1 hypothetical protein SAMN04488050_102264 [Alloyangia pacifica]
MNLTKISVISMALVMSSSAAFANVTQVSCVDFVITIADEIAKAAEERASSVTEAKENICEAAKQISMSGGDDPEVHEIVILPYEIRTTVVITPTDK